MKKFALLLYFSLSVICIYAQQNKEYKLFSGNNKFEVTVNAGKDLSWTIKHGGQVILAPSFISLRLNTGEVLGENVKITSAKRKGFAEVISSVAYKNSEISNSYNELVLTCKGEYGIIFRAYNEGVAYRFFTKRTEELVIQSEQAEYNFNKDHKAFIPHISDLRGGEKYTCSFEEFYTETPLSKFSKDTLGYLPLLIELDNNKKAVLLEADGQAYPGMFVQLNQQVPYGLKATFAPYPLEEALGGYIRINYMVTKRADYIAKVNGTRNFPWRVIVVSEQDKDLLNNDIVQKLSEPNKIPNAAWVKPGKVAWDWWNDWNISHVDFKAGINTPTYKYYIDFAAKNNIEYVVLDEGWSDDWDLNTLNPAIDLRELVEYGGQKNVGLILWSTWYALSRNIEGLCAKYAAMGVKGFKVDFLDRNDQKMVASCYEMASVAAKYQLLLDFHGMFPPQGLQRTWPNVVNFEGVRGMEYSKWSADERVPKHEVSLPFIRMMAGPMDYTPGAMRNTAEGIARPVSSMPVSQGTRCHQLAMYVIYEAPLQMLADNPTIYMKEQECTDLISKIPTVFDQTVALDGEFGEYAVIARKKKDVWYVGGMTNWSERELSIDLSFLGEGNYTAEVFRDGLNAGKDATDYKKEIIQVTAPGKLAIHLAPGGGFVIRLSKL
ncbi:MAG: glycoside hydrolase family 97 protein [Chitinophagaceae bacterium]|nr:glycoside hydrolase family 97 protein [Chitinophagaceae bacterium]